ncbi:MAG: MarR family transcriptional regulator [Acinetobacter sp.]
MQFHHDWLTIINELINDVGVEMIDVTPTDEIVAAWRKARPDLDTDAMAVFARLERVRMLHDLDLGVLREAAPLSAPELDVMVILRHMEEPVIARRIASLRGCSRGAMSNILNKLEARNYIIRMENPVDRRATFVRLSKEGADVVDQLYPRQLAVEAAQLAPLSNDERKKIIEALDLLTKVLELRAPRP